MTADPGDGAQGPPGKAAESTPGEPAEEVLSPMSSARSPHAASLKDTTEDNEATDAKFALPADDCLFLEQGTASRTPIRGPKRYPTLMVANRTKGSAQLLDQLNKMEQRAVTAEERAARFSKSNQRLQTALDKAAKNSSLQQRKANSLAEMLLIARLDKDKAEQARNKLESRFAKSAQGLLLLKSTRLKQELEKSAENVRKLQNKLAEQERVNAQATSQLVLVKDALEKATAKNGGSKKLFEAMLQPQGLAEKQEECEELQRQLKTVRSQVQLLQKEAEERNSMSQHESPLQEALKGSEADKGALNGIQSKQRGEADPQHSAQIEELKQIKRFLQSLIDEQKLKFQADKKTSGQVEKKLQSLLLRGGSSSSTKEMLTTLQELMRQQAATMAAAKEQVASLQHRLSVAAQPSKLEGLAGMSSFEALSELAQQPLSLPNQGTNSAGSKGAEAGINKETREQLESVKQQNALLAAELGSCRARVTAAEGRSNSGAEALQKAENSRRELLKRVDSLENEVHAANERLAEKLRTAEKKDKAQKEELLRLQQAAKAKLDHERSVAEGLKEANLVLQGQVKDLEAKQTAAEGKMKDVKRLETERRAELEGMRSETAAKAEEIKALRKQLVAMQQSCAEAEKKLQERQSEVGKLKEQVGELWRSVDTQTRDFQQRSETLRAAATEAQDLASERKAALDRASLEASGLTETLASARAENAKLQAEVTKALQHSADLSREKDEIVKRLSEELEMASDELLRTHEETQRLSKKLTAVEEAAAKFANSESERTGLQQLLSSLVAELVSFAPLEASTAKHKAAANLASALPQELNQRASKALEALKKQSTQLQDEAVSRSRQLEKEVADSAKLRDQNLKLQKEISEAQQKYGWRAKALQGQAESLQSDLTSTQTRALQLQTMLDHANLQLQESVESSGAAEESRRQQQAAFEKLLDDKQKKLEQEVQERAEAQSLECELRIKLAEQKSLEHYHKNVEAEALAAELENELQAQLDVSEEQQRDADELRRHVTSLQSEATELGRRLEEAGRTNQALARSRDEALEKAAAAATEKQSAAEKLVMQLKEGERTAQQEIAKLKERIAALQADNVALTKGSEDQKLNSLEQDLRVRLQQTEQWGAESISALENQLKVMVLEVNNSQQELNKSEAMCLRLQAALAESEAKLQELNNQAHTFATKQQNLLHSHEIEGQIQRQAGAHPGRMHALALSEGPARPHSALRAAVENSSGQQADSLSKSQVLLLSKGTPSSSYSDLLPLATTATRLGYTTQPTSLELPTLSRLDQLSSPEPQGSRPVSAMYRLPSQSSQKLSLGKQHIQISERLQSSVATPRAWSGLIDDDSPNATPERNQGAAQESRLRTPPADVADNSRGPPPPISQGSVPSRTQSLQTKLRQMRESYALSKTNRERKTTNI